MSPLSCFPCRVFTVLLFAEQARRTLTKRPDTESELTKGIVSPSAPSDALRPGDRRGYRRLSAAGRCRPGEHRGPQRGERGEREGGIQVYCPPTPALWRLKSRLPARSLPPNSGNLSTEPQMQSAQSVQTVNPPLNRQRVPGAYFQATVCPVRSYSGSLFGRECDIF